MRKEKWSQQQTITSIDNTTKLCVITGTGSTITNKIIKPSNLGLLVTPTITGSTTIIGDDPILAIDAAAGTSPSIEFSVGGVPMLELRTEGYYTDYGTSLIAKNRLSFLATSGVTIGGLGYPSTHISGNIGSSNSILNDYGSSNNHIGYKSLLLIDVDNGTRNTVYGNESMEYTTGGTNNTAIGSNAIRRMVSGNNNTGLGYNALNSLKTGDTNTAIGSYAMSALAYGNNNISIGYRAGLLEANEIYGLRHAEGSIFIGSNSKSLATGSTNEIVIGANAIGRGYNTITIGNDLIERTYIGGDILSFGSDDYNIGSPDGYWNIIYCGSSAIDLSDERLKTSVSGLTINEINASKDLARELGVYKFLSAIKSKGFENARKHIGMTVQRAIEIMKSHGLNPFDYGFICYDIKNNGEDVYSFRYVELLNFIARGFDERLRVLEGV